MCWRFLLEEFDFELIYLPEVENVIADCLSRLKYEDNDNIKDYFSLDKGDVNTYLLSYKLIMKYQQKDNKLLQNIETTKCTVYVSSLQQDVHVP